MWVGVHTPPSTDSTTQTRWGGSKLSAARKGFTGGNITETGTLQDFLGFIFSPNRQNLHFEGSAETTFYRYDWRDLPSSGPVPAWFKNKIFHFLCLTWFPENWNLKASLLLLHRHEYCVEWEQWRMINRPSLSTNVRMRRKRKFWFVVCQEKRPFFTQTQTFWLWIQLIMRSNSISSSFFVSQWVHPNAGMWVSHQEDTNVDWILHSGWWRF